MVYNRGEATENYARGAELSEARKAGRVGETGGRCRLEPEYELNGTRNELRSRSIAGRGVAKWGSRNHGDVKSGRSGGRGFAGARTRCWMAGMSVLKK